MRSLIDGETRIAVSGVQDRASGKRNLVDGRKDTCWCSGTPKQHAPVFVAFAFPSQVVPHVLQLTFQGGFVGRSTAVYYDDVLSEPTVRLFPDDINGTQSFDLPQRPIRSLKLVFEDGSDFFGRITIYDLQLHGTDVSEAPMQ